MDRNVALEALGALCNAKVTSVQRQSSGPVFRSAGCPPQKLSINRFISTLLDGDETSQVSQCNFFRIQRTLQHGQPAAGYPTAIDTPVKDFIIDEEEFFAPEYDYNFGNLRDTETYWRGGEKYERPCGWYRFGLKVLNKYGDNTWLGSRFRSTQSSPGEWPVSYHGTSKKGAEGIIEGHYEAGTGQAYGRGIYSTPEMAEAIYYAKSFTSTITYKTYKVILQNRINPAYRKKYNNDKYWLIPIPQGTSDENEEVLVERAIRPYGLLLKEV